MNKKKRNALHLHSSLLTSTIKIPQRNMKGILFFAFSELGTRSHQYWGESKRKRTPTSSSYLVKPSKSYQSAFSDHCQVDGVLPSTTRVVTCSNLYIYRVPIWPQNYRVPHLANQKPVQVSPYMSLKSGIVTEEVSKGLLYYSCLSLLLLQTKVYKCVCTHLIKTTCMYQQMVAPGEKGYLV